MLNDQIQHLNEDYQYQNHNHMGFMSKLKNVGIFLWEVKLLVLVPWDIFTDVKLAVTHFGIGNIGWGSLTVSCLLPSLMFPIHYYQLLKFAMYKFKILFGKVLRHQ